MKNEETVNGINTKYYQLGETYNIFVAHRGYYVNLKSEDILWASSEGNYANIHTKDNQYVNRISLTGLLKLLPPQRFVKIHKCYLVQINAITQIDKTNNEVFVNEQSIPIGRSYRSRLYNELKFIS